MTWISLICLLALSSTAYSRSVYGTAYGSAPAYQQAPRMLSMMREQIIPRAHVAPLPVVAQAYGQQQPITTEWSAPLVQKQQDTSFQQKLQGGYGSAMITPTIIQKTLPVQTYGQISQGYNAMPIISQFDQQIQVQPVPQALPLTQADILCQGQQAETVIPLENGWKFVVCLDDGKGVEQQCPKGLYYHPISRRCERKLGPLENACATQPCLNGGQCIPTDSSYQCQCAPGFDGKTCELDARMCQTQQPCGQAPDTKCQSFRLGAALQYICIFQDGLAYGLSASQAIASPCQDVDGPQALAVSNQGFIMCDGERLFVESCPGGTIWDDVSKACAWPDMQVDGSQLEQQQQQQGYGQSSFAQQKSIVNQPTYGNQWAVQQSQQLPTVGYTTQTLIPQMKTIQSTYGAQSLVPQQMKAIHSYGSQSNNQQLDQSQFGQSSSSSGYGSQWTVPQQAKTIQSTYGAQTLVPQQPVQPSTFTAQIVVPQQMKTIQSYGSQANNQQLDQSQFGQSSSSSGYGSQWTVPQQAKTIQSTYGAQTLVPQQPIQPSAFTAQIVVPQQMKAIHSYGSQSNNQQLDQSQFGQSSSSSGYGSQLTVPQQAKTIQSTYGAQTLAPQQPDLSSSFSAQIVVPQQMKSVHSYGSQSNNQQLDQSQSGQSSSSSSGYGSQWTVPQVKQVQQYGNQIMSRLLEQPNQIQQTYGAQTVVPQVVQTIQSFDNQLNNQQLDQSHFGQSSSSSSGYDSQMTVPQPQIKLVETTYTAQAAIPQAKSAPSFAVQQQKDDLVSEGQSSGY